MPLQAVASAVRIRKGNYLGAVVLPFAAVTVYAHFDLVYDDGTADAIDTNQVTTVAGTAVLLRGTSRALRDGWVVGTWANSGSGAPRNGLFIQFFETPDEAFSLPNVIPIATQEANVNLAMPGQILAQEGPLWAFQGTVAEDATAGTHVATLTVVPGAGNELEVLYGSILEGATATAQTAKLFVDDGTNVLAEIADWGADVTASIRHSFPDLSSTSIGASTINTQGGGFPYKISGTMRTILQVTTVAVSVTQTFAIVGRIRGTTLPTVTLADSVGTPVLTTNTNGVF